MTPRKKLVVAAAAAAAVLGTTSLAFCMGGAGEGTTAAATVPDERAQGSVRPPPAADEEEPAPPALRVEHGPVLSPLTPEMVEHMRDIASRYDRSADVFAKIGDSATVSRAFLECFGGELEEVDLGDAEELSETLSFFRGGNAGGIDPFRRDTEAADVGWSARQLLLGNPPPILREVRAISPRFAFVLNGGNDVEGRDTARFANRMLRIVDHLTSRGVVPILGTTTPRGDDPEAERWVRRYNGVIRAIAAGQSLPLIDFHRALDQLPRQGLAGDRVHPNVRVVGNDTRPCDLTEVGLEYGSNLKNLLALRMLDGLRRTVVGGEPAPAPSRTPVAGEGSVEEPFEVSVLPFTDMGDTSESGSSSLDRYPCSEEHDESGPEYVYRIDAAEPVDLRAWVFSEGDVDVDVHLLRDEPSTDGCIARDDEQVLHRLEPGTWYVVVDTFVGDDGAQAGDFLLVLDEEPAP